MAARGAANLAGSDQKFAGSDLTHLVAPAVSFGAAELAAQNQKQEGSAVFSAAPIDPMSFGTAKGYILGPWAI